MTPLYGPGWGNYAIRGIVEPALPPPVDLWPQTAGWWLLLAAVVLGVALALWRRHQRWLRDRYRRQALASLEDLRTRLNRGDVESLRELAPLLRATALAAGPREELAGLSGSTWSAAVNAMAPGLPALNVDTLQRLAYAPLRPDDAGEGGALIDALGRWIEQHGVVDA